MVQYVQLAPHGNAERTPILSPLNSNWSAATVLGFLAAPDTLEQSFSRWACATMPLPGTLQAQHGSGKLLQPSKDEMYAFRLYQRPARGPDRGMEMLTLPLPLPQKAPTRVVDEAQVLIFKQPVGGLRAVKNE